MLNFLDGQAIQEWAALRDAPSELPRLIRHLIWATVKPGTVAKISFPAGSDVTLPGFDGELEVTRGFPPWIPEGQSIWEMSVEAKTGAKAAKDYEKRMVAFPSPERRATVAYRAVSGRRLTPKTKARWLNERRKDGWKSVDWIDASVLAEWLEQSPAVAVLFAQEIGRVPNGVLPLDYAWEQWSRRSRPTTKQALVLAGREEQHTRLVERLTGPTRTIDVEADSPDEAYGFFLAAITGSDDEAIRDQFRSRTLVVDGANSGLWLSQHQGLILVQKGPNRDLATSLVERHHVLVPLGPEAMGSRDPIRLERASGHQFAEALRAMDVLDAEVDRLARECGRSVTIFHRRRRATHVDLPPWGNDASIVPALLAGRWERSKEEDKRVIATLAGATSYEEVEPHLSRLLRLDDSPLSQVGDVFALVAPADAFEICARLLTPRHLDRFAAVAREVFSEIDPALDLPSKERPYAAMYGQLPRHSRWLRHGMAETLLLIAVRGEAVRLDCPQNSQRFADELIQELPGLASDGRLLASLRDQLPVLMEAAPEPFLDALEQLLEGQPEVLRDLLTEGPHPVMGSEPKHTDLLWGLEALAWDPDLLPRVALILARLAELDPGGRWVNRPINSLRAILLSWQPCTHAPLAARLQALDLVLDRHPEPGWQLLLKLLPSLLDSTSGSSRPRWRDVGEDRAERPTRYSVHLAERAIVDRALARVGQAVERWRALLQHLPAFYPIERDQALALLEQVARSTVEPDAQKALWELVAGFVRRNRVAPDADWALEGEELGRWAELAKRLSPSDPVKRHLWLFTDPWPDVLAEPGEDPKVAQDNAKLAALSVLLEERGLDGAVELAIAVTQPGLVLEPLLRLVDGVHQVKLLVDVAPRFSDPVSYLGILSHIALECFGEVWRQVVVRELALERISAEDKAALLRLWPFEPSTWELALCGGEAIADAYWRACRVDLHHLVGADLIAAVDRLLSAGRAFEVPSGLYRRWQELPPEKWLEVIDAHAEIVRRRAETGGGSPDLGWLRDVFWHLAREPAVDEVALASREYVWLPLVVGPGHGEGSVPALYKILARDPAFFFKLLSDAFRAKGDEKEASSDERRSRAEAAYRVFMNWRSIPGTAEDGSLDPARLSSWTREARRLAASSGRAEVGDAVIGRMLAYSPGDPADGAWPHRAVRDLLEQVGSGPTERSILAEQHAKRGVFTKGMDEGGDQERALAAQAFGWAAIIGPHWPRAQRLLRRIAQMWEEEARRADEQSAKRRLSH